jgi:transcriptional regulator with XRE-family HTH domain
MKEEAMFMSVIRDKKDKINETIAENLRILRAKYKLSQRQLASKVGLEQSIVARIETCDRKMLAEELPVFADALNVSVSQIVGVQQ